MQIQNLKSKTKRLRSRRVARGGKRGKTAGRGTKGQKARAGHKIRPEIRDLIKKLPKKRGYRFASVAAPVKEISLDKLEKNFAAGTIITPKLLVEKGLIGRAAALRVKVLANGIITKALVISGCAVSVSAKTKIEAAGGSIK